MISFREEDPVVEHSNTLILSLSYLSTLSRSQRRSEQDIITYDIISTRRSARRQEYSYLYVKKGGHAHLVPPPMTNWRTEATSSRS